MEEGERQRSLMWILLFTHIKQSNASFYSLVPCKHQMIGSTFLFHAHYKKKGGLQMQLLWGQGFPPIQIRNAAQNPTIDVCLKAAQVSLQQRRRVGYYQIPQAHECGLK